MNHRFFQLAASSLIVLAAFPALAQGLRPSGQAGSTFGSINAAPPTQEAARQADFIVAVVNSEPITNNEVRARLGRLAQQLAQQGGPQPNTAELTQQVLERLILEKAQLQIARENGVKVDEAAVDQAEQAVARQNQIDVAELRRRVAREGLPVSRFREELRNQMMLTRLRDRELDSRVKITDADVEQYLRQQQNETQKAPEGINLAMLLVAVPEGATPDQVKTFQAKADALLARAKGGADFTALVREASDAPDRTAGGVLGMRSADRYPQLFVDGVRDVKVGGYSPVLRSAAGFHILKLLDKQQSGMPTAVPQNHARHILLRPNAELTEAAAVERLAGFKRRIEAGQVEFANIAREYSEDGSASQGGDLGWSSPGQFVPEFEEALEAMKVGQISNPVVSRYGVHLIQLLEQRELKLTPKEQREMVRNALREKKLDESYATWLEEIRARAYVEMREPPQ
jgi:peptidyl-prolyl cis-trans isomerase SurA